MPALQCRRPRLQGTLQPHLEIGGCLFTHVEPWLDPHKVEDLWYFDGPPDSPEKLARSFAAVPQDFQPKLTHARRKVVTAGLRGLSFEDDKPDTLAEAMAAPEKGLDEYFKREGIELEE